jgi:glycosyltransferase involved in cell wall biosynthesis
VHPGQRELLAVIPAFNEEASVGAVVEAVRNVLGCDVVVVDDGSSDETGIAASRAGATVLRLPYNLGVGGALRTAFRYSVDKGYQRVVQVDGDGQHEAAEAKRLLEELESTGCDFVIGARFVAGFELGRARRFSMWVLSKVVSRKLRTRITDTTSGFRALGPRALRVFATRYPVDYLSDTVEALLIAGEEGLVVREVDVRMHPRQGGVPSASPLRSTYHLGRLLIGVAVRETRRRPAHQGGT